jgi:2-polyprenyl-3-methyl-5-hydroxy-6-metoxy-1,4-benzoquinol methylase
MTSPSEISSLADRLYAGEGLATRLLQHYRPFICPFDRMTELVPAGSHVLDVGCGTGLFLLLLQHRGKIASGVGIDAGGAAIASARRAAGANPALRFEIGRIPVPDFKPAEPFDVVSMVDLLHHVPSAERANVILWAANLLKPGGILLIKDIAPGPWWMARASQVHDLLMARELVRFSTPEAIDGWAGLAGCTKALYERVPILCYAHEIHVYRRRGP